MPTTACSMGPRAVVTIVEVTPSGIRASLSSAATAVTGRQ